MALLWVVVVGIILAFIEIAFNRDKTSHKTMTNNLKG
jgi:hypothetical protein